MLPLQRHETLLRQLEVSGIVRTTDLASQFRVTDETIRRDLDMLARSNRLERIHGGAKLPSHYRTDLPLQRRITLQREAKEVIARRALERIQPGVVIFLDASTTALTLVNFLPEVELTVITNAIDVIHALDGRPRIRVIGTGGTYERISRSFVGNAAVETVRRHQTNLMFIGCNGVEAQRGASEVNAGQAALKERIREFADELVLLADHSKLGKKSDNYFANLSQVNSLITDSGADPRELNRLREAGLKVEIARLGAD